MVRQFLSEFQQMEHRFLPLKREVSGKENEKRQEFEAQGGVGVSLDWVRE